MRAVLFEATFRSDLFLAAAGLNALYLGAAATYFLVMFRAERVHGLLLQQGE